MKNRTVEQQAKVYLFDLENCAKEHWFKPDEGWEFSLVTDAEKIAIEKKYKPTISTKALPEVLLQLLGIVKSGQVNEVPGVQKAQPGQGVTHSHMQHLIAFNPNRLR